MKSSRVALLSSHYINAYSLVRGLSRVGFDGRVIALKPRGYGKTLLEVCRPDVTVWELSDDEAGTLPAFLGERLADASELAVLFADERLLPVFQDRSVAVPFRFARPPMILDHERLEIVLDRFLFYDFLQTHNLARVPHSFNGWEDPVRRLGYPFLLRPKRSWRGMEKLPRPRIIETDEQWAEARSDFASLGIGRDDVCFQEVLSVSDRHNVSVCGWHGATHPIHHVTRKVLQHPPKTGNGDVVETIDDPGGLLPVTAALLDALGYEGPFELEFVLDTRSGAYHVIELNPRFWMQHELLNVLYDDELILRALGEPPRAMPRPISHAVWVNSVYGLFRLMRGQVKMLAHIHNAEVLAPSFPDALRWLPTFGARMARERLENSMRGRREP